MDLTIVGYTGQKKYTIDWIELNTPTGNYVIQHGHAPTILQLNEQKEMVFSLASGNIETIKNGATLAHITREKVIILMNK